MGEFSFRASERINLAKAEILLIEGQPESLSILTQMFNGFGAESLSCCTTAKDAQAVVRERELDLVVVDSALEDMNGFDFVRWLRRSGVEPNCFAPTILITGHTKEAHIHRGRDAGAHFVIRKPVSPLTMMQRVVWISREARPFVDSPSYCGPDRRFKALGPPSGMKGRRHDDLSLEVGLAKEPNLDQSEIDALLQPKRAMG